MSNNDCLEWVYCPICHHKLFAANYLGLIQIKCTGCGSIVEFEKRPKNPMDIVIAEKIIKNIEQ